MAGCNELLNAALEAAEAARAHLASLVRITRGGVATFGDATATYDEAWRKRYAELKEARDRADAAYADCMARR